MAPELLSGGVIGVAGIVMVALLIWLLTKPLRWFVKLAWHVVCGVVLLLIVNFFGEAVGIFLPLSLFNIGVAAIFGIPGVAVLALAPLFL